MTLLRHTTTRILSGSVRRALAPHWGALLGLALFLIAGLAVLDDYGVFTDGEFQRATLEANLGYLASGDLRAFTGALTVFSHEKFYGVVFEATVLFVERAFGLRNARDVDLVQHLISHLTLLIGGLFAYMLARRLFGSRLLALAAMLLFLLHPRLHAHSFFNAKDIPFLVVFMAALYLTHRAFKRDAISAFALLGAAVGILVNLRIMGVVLLAAIPAMRALDFAFAQGGEERKRVLLTTGAFALTGALTTYALLPYLWGDPVGRAAEWWTTLSDHPRVGPELFRGTLYPSDALPVEYLPVWFSITAPPFALLLGAVGAGAIVVRAGRAPRKALRSGRLRFGLLLVGCFALPVFAVMLSGANIYNTWRHMFFLWAPFALLGALGLRWLAGALGGRARIAVYGSAGAGLAAAVVSMTLLHPYQQMHFNFFVDRVAPEHLRSQYEMDYWSHPIRQALERHLDHSAQSSSGPNLNNGAPAVIGRYRSTLPESARERLANAAPFGVAHSRPWASWSRSAREMHRVEVYGSAAWTFELRDAPREVYEAVRGREPVIDGAFDVHRIDGALALVMEPCAPAFMERSVTVRALPADAADLPAWRRGKAREPRRFYLGGYGAYLDGKCAASLPLPAYPIADFELRWSTEPLDAGEAREKARRARNEGRLLASAEYDIYLADGELVYINDSCDPLETEHPFRLNVYPEPVGDLSEARRERDYEWFRIDFHRNGAFVDGGCAAFFPLPDYPIASIRTGQSVEGGEELWRAGFALDAEPYRAAHQAAVSGEPLARSAFDVYLADRALVYVKEPCEQADTAARFFLHIAPERVADLPEERAGHGFDNLDFEFFLNGAFVDGGCVALFPLPDYPVTSVRTGQSAEGGGELWRAGFALDAEPYRAAHQAAVSGEPLARSAFDVYLSDGALVYAKEECEQSDMAAKFFLHVAPERVGDLPEERRESGFDNLDFEFFLNGALFDGRCAARVSLPDYPVASIRTGQSAEGGAELWRAGFALDAEPYRAAHQAAVSGEPLARSAFDVYLSDGALVYAKEECEQSDMAAKFFLHVAPERVGDLPEERRESGFDNLDFEFFLNGALFDGRCAARVSLPDYPVASIRTGQSAEGGGELWRTEFALNAEPYRAAYEDAVSGEPVARGAFDVHLSDGALVYVKEPCEQGDTDAKFFLHIAPERVGDLPEERRESGFDNLDFAFFLRGALFDGKCAARVSLQDYPIASIRTGQHAGGGELWRAEFAVGR